MGERYCRQSKFYIARCNPAMLKCHLYHHWCHVVGVNILIPEHSLVSSSNDLMTIGSTQWLPSTGGRLFNYFTQDPCTNSAEMHLILICFFLDDGKPNSDCIKIVENAFEL
ncbi:conserved hypothetical protein [Trichinella spiralis]|uniref:hypothetical protein n=1 Tax=Trichinella spiralis TaxID=6334 RepID=UPI0001EFD40B|nr:conserved hypothetical protein [Trichinella spiralis]